MLFLVQHIYYDLLLIHEKTIKEVKYSTSSYANRMHISLGYIREARYTTYASYGLEYSRVIFAFEAFVQFNQKLLLLLFAKCIFDSKFDA